MTLVSGEMVVFVCWAIVVAYWMVAALFVRQSVSKTNRHLRVVWVLANAIVFLALFRIIRNFSAANGTLPGVLFRPSSIQQMIGSAVTVLGLVCALWARTTLGKNWSAVVTQKEDHELVTCGPYRYVRHPIYSSLILMSFGSFLTVPTAFTMLLILYFGIIFARRKRKEEELMLRMFGKTYEDYMRRTKALIPGVW